MSRDVDVTRLQSSRAIERCADVGMLLDETPEVEISVELADGGKVCERRSLYCNL